MHIVQTLRSLVKPTWHKLPVGKLQRTVRGTPKQLKTFQNRSLHKLLLLEACLGFRVCSKDLSPFNTTSTAKQKASALAHHQAKGLKEITTSKTVKNQMQLLYLLLNRYTMYSIPKKTSDLNSKATTEVWIKVLWRLLQLKQRPSILGSERFEDGNRTVKRCHCSVIWNYHCSTNNAPFLRKSILTIHLHCLI